MDGGAPANESYQVWLRRQSVEVQEEALGKTKAKLFREGNLSVDRFIDAKGNELTIDELRKKEMAAFRKAKV